MDLNAIQDSFERVAKRQKVLSSKFQEVINQVGHEIEQSLASVQSNSDSAMSVVPKSVLTELKAKLSVTGSKNQFEGLLREFNIDVSKHQKVLEKILNPDISKAYRNVDFDPHILNQIIINHLYREGQFDTVDCLIKEAGESEALSLRSQFQDIQQILEAVKSKKLEPALKWVSINSENLKEVGSDLELKLHKLQFVDILQNRSRADAIAYVKTYLSPFASHHMKEIQKLMGSLLWAGKLDRSPYADLLDPLHWEKFAVELMQMFCNISGQPFRDPLNIAVSAGVEGLPTLLKLVNVMAAKKQEWHAMKQIPVPVELGKEFQFHSIFVCPVSRDQASDENPPMLLPCGHVLCKQSINKLSKNNSRNFKCPYCPLDASAGQCKQLYF